MSNYIRNLLLSLVLSVIAPFTAIADEVTDVVNDIASKLVLQLPMNKKIALKSLSPDETGLPEDFLRKLTSDLEAALLLASDFEINLANRATMEDVWQEAIEFNNANFDELYKKANSDIMMVISPRAIANGVEIAISAYALTGEDVGKVLASSGSVLLPIDLKQNLGIDVKNLNQQMVEILEEIEKVGQTGGLISNPNTYAEFYHNARVLQQSGDVDLSMRNYEQALAKGYLFVDPLLNLLKLANARYGEKGTQQFFEKKIKDNIPEELSEVAEIYLGLRLISDVYSIKDIAEKRVFSPTLAAWLSKKSIEVIADNTKYNERSYKEDYFFMEASRIVVNSYKTSEFQSYFIDKVAATKFVNIASLEASLKRLNRFEYTAYLVDHKSKTAQNFVKISECVSESWGDTSSPSDVKLELETSFVSKIEKISGRLGARPLCNAAGYNNGIDATESDGWSSSSYGFSVSNILGTGETNECRFTPEMDRLVFADLCKEERYTVLGQLLITDSVDTKKPIIVSLGIGLDNTFFYKTDISIDGTYVSELPAPITMSNEEGMLYHKAHPNKWFFAPGIIQSSLQTNEMYGILYPAPFIGQIEYTDIYGQKKVVQNAMISSFSCCWGDESGDPMQQRENFGWDRTGKAFPIINSNPDYDIPLVFYGPGWPYLSGERQDMLRELHNTFSPIDRYSEVEENEDVSRPELKISMIEAVFKSETLQNRRSLQQGLKNLGFYEYSSIDGKWGKGTKNAFEQMFAYLNKYYPDREYVSDFGFDDEKITQKEFINFWVSTMGCDPEKLLSITSACAKN